VDISIRAYEVDRDAARVAELWTATGPEPWTEADVREIAAQAPQGRVALALIAEDGLGYAKVFRDPWHAEGRFYGDLHVAAAARRRGIGSRLLAELEAFALAHGGTRMALHEVSERDPGALPFVTGHGYEVDGRMFESTVDPSRVAPALLTAADPAGIEITSLAVLGNTEPNRQRLHELNERVAQDDPANTGHRTPRPFDAFARQVFEASWFRAEGQFVARHGDRWVGLGAVGYFATTNSLYHMFTGVEPAYRGRGIATALKRATIRYGLEIGAAYLRTDNDSRNAPMLAVNRRYGYRPEPGFHMVSRALTRRPPRVPPGT